MQTWLLGTVAIAALSATLDVGAAPAAQPRQLLVGQPTPTGQRITPEAAPGVVFQALNPNLADLPDFTAGQAAAVALSPDGKILLVMTSGYNRNAGPDGKYVPGLSNEYVFAFDIAGPLPVKRQVLQVPNTYQGLAWHPTGDRFYVAGGVDDAVHEFRAGPDGLFTLTRTLPLGHQAGLGIDAKPAAAGLAVNPSGERLLVANLQNESVSLVDLAAWKVIAEQDLRPGEGAPGGTFPNTVVWASPERAYVTSQRDREVIALAIGDGRLSVDKRLKTSGQPAAMIMSPDGSRLYVALDNSDSVLVLDAGDGNVIEEVPAAAPREVLLNPRDLKGANPNGLALSPDGQTLFVSQGGLNSLAAVRLGRRAVAVAVAAQLEAAPVAGAGSAEDEDEADAAAAEGDAEASRVVGLMPTGWYPTAVAVRPDGRRLYIVNGKGNAGPNPLGCRDNTRTTPDATAVCRAADQYVWQLEKAGFLSMPVPAPAQIAQLTRQVAANNAFPGAVERGRDDKVMAFVRSRIRHVVYIVKENRTYDQVLGDLEVGDGDPSLALLPEPVSPNHHALARQFVTLDSFLDSGETSNTGWNWTTAARTTDFTEREAPVNYADRGLQYDQEGTNRDVNVGLATAAERVALNPATPDDPNLLPGTADVAAPDGPGGLVGTGYLWDAALRAGLTVRNYGFYGDLARYDAKHQDPIPPTREPARQELQIFFPTKASLSSHSDLHFRGYDMTFPDYWRFKEWEREFDAYAATDELPNLTLLRLPHDHFGAFSVAVDGVDTIETQMADNDYAVGLVVEKIAKSPFARNTLVLVVEDDAQNGADHVDAHRSIALVAGPYVRREAVVSERYTTVSMLRTIEDVLGIEPMGLNDGLAAPMAEVFDPGQAAWSYEAVVPEVLRTTQLPLPPAAARRAEAQSGCLTRPLRTAGYWEAAMAGQDFSFEDRLDAERFNTALWRGLKGEDVPLPGRDGRDLRNNRAALLAAFQRANGCG